MNKHTGRLGFPQPALFVVINIEAGEGAREDSATTAIILFLRRLFFVLTPKWRRENLHMMPTGQQFREE